ncbi:ATP synthase E chain-domain-containing protein [Boletus reticuloceps]|uniref:ATP synthase F(0) complex subunit e, mitochondrial n=1 Tax=Boletus reticuloceps TaxID=495285 RepID=A0A8I2Z1V7_9AGAM|nr:ATP synthase E chain-domain-containing protein [Boletus reticuloceps]
MSSTLNVARYTALASGIFYGIYHHRSLQKAHDQEKEHHAIRRREQLIAQARDAWRQKKESFKSDGDGKRSINRFFTPPVSSSIYLAREPTF